MEEKIMTRHPHDKKGVNIHKRKYDLMSQAILGALSTQTSLTHKDLLEAVEDHLQEQFDGSIPWYMETVKLDLEARDKIVRLTDRKPAEYALV
ncbi:hypothetical protein PZB74_06970 [Porifericola rhodea]|uniref:DUF6958 family protein n=1 Tax=Porifericola rhodea TaxID=930972 RepID=UPI002665D028|nr:hypothetical protein [Porifericola rhodea]WKN33084.1 hypothetical protein PZB74_06970 [Porifericola rhodea]